MAREAVHAHRTLIVAVGLVTAALAAAVPPGPALGAAAPHGAWSTSVLDAACEARDGGEPLLDSPRVADVAGVPRAREMLVRPLLLVPSDVATDSARAADLDAYRGLVCPTVTEVQRFFADATAAVGGLTFAFQRPVEVTSEKPLAWYGCHGLRVCREPVRWENFLADLVSKGYAWYEPNRVTLVFMPGAGGFSGGAFVGGPAAADAEGALAAAGVALLGDFALAGLAEACDRDEWWCSHEGGEPRDQQTGAVAHELGHALGLHHPDRACSPGAAASEAPCEATGLRFRASVMGAWWDFPSRGGLAASGGFNPEERARLAVSPMLRPAADAADEPAAPLVARAAP